MESLMHHTNLELVNIENEEWADVVGYDGIYNISTLGRVKSLGRFVNASNGGQRWVKEKILKQTKGRKHGTLTVKLSHEGIAKTYNILGLVGDGFMLEKKGVNDEYCHKNKILSDNRLSNIIVTSHSNSLKLNYVNGNMKNWGIEQIPKERKLEYEKVNGHYIDGILYEKKCKKCGEYQSLTFFYNGNVCKDCHPCNKKTKRRGESGRRRQLAEKGFRYCSVCKRLKRLDLDFGKHKNAYMGKTNNCKDCTKVLNEKYRTRKALDPDIEVKKL